MTAESGMTLWGLLQHVMNRAGGEALPVPEQVIAYPSSMHVSLADRVGFDRWCAALDSDYTHSQPYDRDGTPKTLFNSAASVADCRVYLSCLVPVTDDGDQLAASIAEND